MPQGTAFPHLKLALREKFRAKFGRGVGPNAEVEHNKQNRPAHVGKLRGSLQRIRDLFRVEIERRQREGLPAVDAGAGFVMRIPDGADPDAFAHALGVELVAEVEGGFMLVATEDLTFARLEEILAKFNRGSAGGGAAAALLDVFEAPDAPHRIERLLAPDVLRLWPFRENQEYIFDVSIQTAEGTRSFSIPRVVKRRDESDEQFQQRKQTARQDALANADGRWADAAEKRFDKLVELVSFYGGEIM